jgi:putative CocE/NonD family hydrolase
VARDHLTHPYFAGHGYAGVRVDMRGTGDSEGVCLGEYLLQEQDDALAVIDWLAAQPWCSGKVGMIGILGRVQRPPDRRAAAGGARRRHHAVLHR